MVHSQRNRRRWRKILPDFEEFTGPGDFSKIFNKYEQNVIKTRNEVVAAATETYLNELAKKNQRRQQYKEKEVKDQRHIE